MEVGRGHRVEQTYQQLSMSVSWCFDLFYCFQVAMEGERDHFLLVERMNQKVLYIHLKGHVYKAERVLEDIIILLQDNLLYILCMLAL